MGHEVVGTPWRRFEGPVSDEALACVDRYWRCANYLSVGEIYLRQNPLMREPFTQDDVKRRLVGHWGTTPGINFLYAHLNRLIVDHGQSTLVVAGPGHGGAAGAAEALLDGTLRERMPELTDDLEGLQRFCRQYAFPGGISSNFAPEIPGSIHKGGELGYALVHAFGAALDNPDLLVVAVVGDGEAETAPTAASWQLSRILSPASDGLVLPVVHLNGYKISNPTVLARISEDDRRALFKGLGYEVLSFRAGFDDEPAQAFHARFAAVLERAFRMLCDIKDAARSGAPTQPVYPLIMLETPKGWTCPSTDGEVALEGSWRTHDVPFADAPVNAGSFERLRSWLASYGPKELFDERGSVRPEVSSWLPKGALRLGACPQADGGSCAQPLALPDPFASAAEVLGSDPSALVSPMAALGAYLRDIVTANEGRFRLFSPDELFSNRLQGVLAATGRQWNAPGASDPANDVYLAPSGAVVEVLSEHLMEGLLEGYTLTGRSGVFATYEAFAQVVSSMVGQHCKWLESVRTCAPWRAPVPALNIVLTSHVWRQEHNGFSHQDPGFADVLLNKRFGGEGEDRACAGASGASRDQALTHVYYAADASLALAVAERAFAARNCVNALVMGKQPLPVLLSADEARSELEAGAALWPWASTENGEGEPDVVLASVGDVPTVEALAAAELLGEQGLSVRFVNVVDLFRLAGPEEDAGAIDPAAFEELFGRTAPVVFAFHGYPGTLKRLLFDRPNTSRFTVCGFRERGATTSPFMMLYLTGMDRWALAACALRRIDAARCEKGAHEELVATWMERREHAAAYACEHGCDDPAFAEYVPRRVR